MLLKHTTDMLDNHQTIAILVGLAIFGLFIVAMWRGSQNNLPIAGAEKAIAERAEASYTNSTISPTQEAILSKTCSCPANTSEVVQGTIALDAVMGQSQHEGNSPYLYENCRSDAAEMFSMLQDEQVFLYARSMVRSDIGSYPPSKLYFSWDQRTGQCNFYTSCSSMTACSDTAQATGLIA